jgi:hypothetical protein
MQNLIFHVHPPGATEITKGTERFNMVIQEYPLKFLLSNSRKVKYITKENVQKYDRYIDRKYTPMPPSFPKEFIDWHEIHWSQAIVDDHYVWRLTLGSGTWYIANRFKKAVEDGQLGWFEKPVIKDGKKNTVEVLGYPVVGNPSKLDKTRGANGYVVANPKAAGTERFGRINGQDIWNGNLQEHTRAKLKDFLTAFFAPHITQQLPEGIWPPKDHFIQTEFIFYYPFGLLKHEDHGVDIDNHAYPYVKAFHDTLTELQVIKGDGPKHIRGYYAHYIEVETEKERRMEVKFHFCKNDQVPIPRIYQQTAPTTERFIEPESDPL